MAKNKNKNIETPKEEAIIEKVAPKIGDILKELSADYFKRFPKVETFYAVESKQFFFKRNDAQRNAGGKEVYTFNRQK